MEMNINDVFWTFQGEGLHSGRRALFVRMPFCNLSCSWCDTKFDSFKKWAEQEFVEFATKENAKFAVITGGEPMMNKHTPKVIEILKSLGFEIACETNGNFPIFEGVNFVTVSPKKEAAYRIHPDAAFKASEFKWVIDEGFDFDILREFQKQDFTKLVRLSLSPEFNNFHQSLEKIYDFIKENPRWRISLQTHKWMKIP